MAKFAVGDRVAYRENLKTVGVVVRIVAETVAGARLLVAWDYGVNGEIDESELVRELGASMG